MLPDNLSSTSKLLHFHLLLHSTILGTVKKVSLPINTSSLTEANSVLLSASITVIHFEQARLLLLLNII